MVDITIVADHVEKNIDDQSFHTVLVRPIIDCEQVYSGWSFAGTSSVLSVSGVDIVNCTTEGSADPGFSHASTLNGAGLYFEGYGLHLFNVSLVNNRAGNRGGGLFANVGLGGINITSSIINSCMAENAGGGYLYYYKCTKE